MLTKRFRLSQLQINNRSNADFSDLFSDINKRHKRSLHVDVQMSAISLTNSTLFPVRLV